MLEWLKNLVQRPDANLPAADESWIAQAANESDVESRIRRWEERASEYGLRLP